MPEAAAQWLKGWVLRAAPPGLLRQLKRRYYRHALPRFDEPDGRVARELVDPGDWAVDIGANAGWYTQLLADRVGPAGRVTAIEPIPPTFDVLDYCVRSLGLLQVDTHCCAVSREDGAAEMEVPPWESGGENFYQARIADASADGAPPRTDARPRFQVPLRSLDSLLGGPSAGPGALAFIKCDVEGHELAVFEGASGVLAAHRPSLLVEVSGDPDEDGSEAGRLFGLLSELGYRAHRFDGETLHERAPGDESVNYFFLQPQHVARLRARGLPVASPAPGSA